MSQVGDHYRSARRLWPRPDHRRLSGVSRSMGSSGCSAAKREERAQIDDMWPTDEVIRVREELAEQMRALEDLAAMAKLYELRYHTAGKRRPGSVSVDLLRLSWRDQGGERRGNVDRAHLELPRHLHRARPAGWRTGRNRCPGIVGSTGAKAPYRPLSPNTGI